MHSWKSVFGGRGSSKTESSQPPKENEYITNGDFAMIEGFESMGGDGNVNTGIYSPKPPAGSPVLKLRPSMQVDTFTDDKESGNFMVTTELSKKRIDCSQNYLKSFANCTI